MNALHWKLMDARCYSTTALHVSRTHTCPQDVAVVFLNMANWCRGPEGSVAYEVMGHAKCQRMVFDRDRSIRNLKRYALLVYQLWWLAERRVNRSMGATGDRLTRSRALLAHESLYLRDVRV